MNFQVPKKYATAPTPIKGGKYFSFTSASDPYGSFYVVCDKHPEKHIPVSCKFSMSEDSTLTLEDNFQEALQTCEGCTDERAHLTSRWPNAGMPGGAELRRT